MAELFFHEDDQEMGDIDLVSNYVAYPGNTWEIANAQVYSPADKKVKFESANILLSEVEEILANLLPKFERVKTGYGRTSWEFKCGAAYGSDHSFAVILENSGVQVKSIWFLISEISEKEKEALKELFSYLASKGEFLFSDNHWNFQCKTSEWNLFEAYCADKFE
tara:strand:+ start:481 stop:975 length:495 start_codon:yes stop_codon:yes gene_type:complete